MKQQPKALMLLVSVQMWECFSFYGMRVLLVLYMIHNLKFTDTQAFGVFALYTALVEFGGILGGIAADRCLGLRKAISLGGWLILSGHVILAFGSETLFFFPALALIIIGSGLFSSNLSAMLGLFYEEQDGRREAGYTLFYAGINLGSLLASLLCGYVGDQFGWHYGFGLAAIGMLIGNSLFHYFGAVLEDKGKASPKQVSKRGATLVPFLLILAVLLISQGLQNEEMVFPLVPWVFLATIAYVAYRLVQEDSAGVQKIAKAMLYILAIALFFAAEEQMGTSITLFSDRHATKSLWSIPIPPSVLLSINPAVIIIFGTLMNRLSGKISGALRMILPFSIAACAFVVLAWASPDGRPVPVLFVIGMTAAVAFAELMVGPTAYSFCAEIATKKHQGMVMGLVPIGFSLASVIGGHLAKWMAIDEADLVPSFEVYREGFLSIGVILFSAAAILGIGLILVSKMKPVSEAFPQ
ncbi:MAG: peptide MFS transporter [Parachlamydia sp.]|nr:peptide MFS transporter [Parachlamydia sp.]